jgi:hypothetical protein
MDNKQPQIISSGARHSVQVGLDNKNAQTKRNIVSSNEPDAEDAVIGQETTTERGHAQLKQSVEAEEKARSAQAEADVSEEQKEGRNAFVGEGAAARERAQGHVPTEPGKAPGQTGSVMRESQAEDTGGLAKEGVNPDRFLGAEGGVSADEELKGSREGVLADRDGRATRAEHEKDRMLSGNEDTTAERDLKIKKEGVASDEVLSGEEEGLPDRDGRVAKEAVKTDEELSAQVEVPEKDNRQKINELADAAQRIKLQAQSLSGGPARADNPLDIQRALAELEGEDEPAPPVAEPEPEVQAPVAAPAAAEVLPEPAPVAAPKPMTLEEIAESEFQARMRALKTNMTVTDGILTQLQKTPPRV